MNLDGLKNQDIIAVGLSGGGDSMALTHMLCQWAAENNKTIHALSVDHNLRSESMKEMQQVSEWIKNFPNCHHEILYWNHDQKPETAVMEKARDARYDLMIAYCKAHDIQTLCVAHHADDQLETFLFRFAKGSGLDGLTGMKEKNMKDGIMIFRPLLNQTHQDLIAYCLSHNLQWIEDPSNQNTDYARPRLRQALLEEGLTGDRLSKTLGRMTRAKEALEWLVDSAINACVADNIVDWEKLKTYPLDIQIRVLNHCLMKVGEPQSYPPKLERVEEIVETLQPGKSATLYNCLMTLSKDGKALEIKPSQS